MTRKKNVLVLGGMRKSCLPLIRELYDAGFAVTVANDSKLCFGFATRYAKKRLLAPSFSDLDAVARFLIDEVQKNEYEMVFAIRGDLTDLLAKHQAELAKYTKILAPSFDAIRLAGDKIATMKAAQEAGVSIPQTWFPTRETIEATSKEVVFPVLVKPARGTGARGIVRADNPTELVSRFRNCVDRYGESFVQEMVAKPHIQYKAEVLLDRDSKFVSGIVGKKLRYYPAEGGSSTLCRSVEFPELLNQGIKILQHLKWVGFADFDFIYHPETDRVLLIEINPRFPECYGYAYASGLSFANLMFKIASGEKIEPSFAPRLNQYFRFMPADALWFLTSSDRFNVKPSFFRFFGRDVHYCIGSIWDPGPAFCFFLENFTKFFNKKERDFLLKTKKKDQSEPSR